MDLIDGVPGRAAHRLYCHFVWPTLGRLPLISGEAVAVVERHVITLCRRLDAEPICVRAFSDRVHLVLRLNPGHSPAALVSRLKSGTESALQAAGHTIRWGRGYAAASVSGGEVRAVMRRVHRLADAPLSGAPVRPKTRPRKGSRRAMRYRGSSVDAPHSTG
jgi:REP element-mobilizing transposase RayT